MQVRQLKARKANYGFEIMVMNTVELMDLMVWTNECIGKPTDKWFMEMKTSSGYGISLKLNFYFDEANLATLFKTRWIGEK
jgi:hypothetical protein